MNKILAAATLAITGLMAASAMAAPDYRNDDRRYSYAYGQNHHDQHYDHKYYGDQHWNNNRVDPSRHWRVGQTLPRGFDSSRYKVSDRDARRLPNTGRYQQWYKINGDYVLVNQRTDRIVRIMN